MFRNYIVIALRNLIRQKAFFFINISGLAIGMAVCLLFMAFVQDELSYDRFHKNADRIYRVVQEFVDSVPHDYFAHTPAPLAPALMKEFPEVVNAVRFATRQRELITYKNKQFWEKRLVLVDPSIFQVFTFPLVAGDPETALEDPHSVVITESIARKYFGNENPIGKIIRVGSYQAREYNVTGVLKDIPHNSQLQFDFLISFAQQKGNIEWGQSNYTTYMMLPAGFSPGEIEKKFPDFIEKYLGRERRLNTLYHLQPLTQIHLYSKLRNDLPTNRDISHVYFFSLLAFIILLIACINYMNLAMALSIGRTKEVGLRKVIGARRLQIVWQFLSESTLLSGLALPLALMLAEFLLPTFNALAGTEVRLKYLGCPVLLAGLPGIVLFVGIGAGSYPALFLSAFQPVNILKGRITKSTSKTSYLLRKALVIAQFTLSIIFITCTVIIFDQLSFIRHKNLGYDKEHLIVIPIYYTEMREKYKTFKEEITQNPNVLAATATSYLPSSSGYLQNAWWEGLPEQDFTNMMRWISVDQDFVRTLGLQIAAGRDFFAPPSGGTPGEEYILNESAVKKLGWKQPIGKRFKIIKKGTIVGVVKDFHFRSLHHEIEPVALYRYPAAFYYLYVRIGKESISQTVSFLEKKWKHFIPEKPFEYFFLDEDFDRIYKAETRLSKIVGYVGAFVIFIACLGLFGLAAFAAERRTKEIGIRKVLGATVTHVVALLSKDFVKLVLLANLIAWPVAWWAMNKWLENFAYRISIEWWVFALAGGLALVIALLTVSTQAVKTALANPVDSLRYE